MCLVIQKNLYHKNLYDNGRFNRNNQLKTKKLNYLSIASTNNYCQSGP